MEILEAAEAVASARHLLITAGAGMGVDSGLPDFRGDAGFWKAYPPYARLGMRFTDLADPDTLANDAELGWGFYGHRLHLYRATVPHEGFAILQRWAARMASAFVVTSNVDGQFQRAGFEEASIWEIHGSIHHMQCLRPCSKVIQPADAVSVEVDETTMRAKAPLPECPRCGDLARPNILMFGDYSWLPERTEAQREAFEAWATEAEGPTVVVELGAGTAIPSIRSLGERFARRRGARLVRINVRESQVPSGQLGLAMKALEALSAIDRAL